MVVTLEVSHLDTLEKKFDVSENILTMLVTLDVSQLDTSAAKFDV